MSGNRAALHRVVDELPERSLPVAERLLLALFEGRPIAEVLVEASPGGVAIRRAPAEVAWGGIADWPTPDELVRKDR